MMTRQSIALLLIGMSLAAAGASSLHGKAKRFDRLPAPEPVSVVVSARRFQPGPVKVTLHAIAEVQATREITLNSRLLGYVATLPLSEGMSFSAGAVLARIAPVAQQATAGTARESSLQAELTAAGSTLAAEEERLRRIQSLHKTALVSTEQMQVAEATVAAARARLATAREALSNATILAPFDGVVSRRLAQVGDLVSVDKPLLKITDLGDGNRLFVDVPVGMNPTALVLEQQSLPLREWPEATFEGTRRYEARTLNLQVMPGSRIRVRIEVFSSPLALLLPSDCSIAGDTGAVTLLLIDRGDGGERIQPLSVPVLAQGDEGSAVAPFAEGAERALACASPDILIRLLAGARFRSVATGG